MITSERLIKKVLDPSTGAEVLTADLLAGPEHEMQKLRRELKEAYLDGKPRYVCHMCNQMIYLKGTVKQEHTVYHPANSLFSCPLQEKTTLTRAEINRRRFNGAKESQAHIQLKQFLDDMLSLDSRFSEVKQEPVIKNEELKTWRRPDVSSIFNEYSIICIVDPIFQTIV
ncbi:MAG: hypothetical protein JRG71_11230 [Deltaproteobacteria bacterium]|nr:hypothetical protein [Deltaproteobacteria bacterium]